MCAKIIRIERGLTKLLQK